MPMSVRGRLMKKVVTVNKAYKRALWHMIQIRKTIVIHHPEFGPALSNLIQETDYNRHNFIVCADSIFTRGKVPRYTRATLDALERRAQPVVRGRKVRR